MGKQYTHELVSMNFHLNNTTMLKLTYSIIGIVEKLLCVQPIIVWFLFYTDLAVFRIPKYGQYIYFARQLIHKFKQ